LYTGFITLTTTHPIDDDDDGRINFSMMLRLQGYITISLKREVMSNEMFLVTAVRPSKKFGFQSAAENLQR